jgi:uncharacterized protein
VTNPHRPTVGPDGSVPPPFQGQQPAAEFGVPAGYPPPDPVGPEKDPPRKWGFGAFLLAEAVFVLTSMVVPVIAIIPYALRDPAVKAADAPMPGGVLVAALSVPPIVAAIVALLATRLRGNGPVVDLRLRFGMRDVGIGVACGVVGVFLTIPLGLLWARWVGEENANSAVGEVFDGRSLPIVLAAIVFLQVWLVAPICEEIIFRGLLWGAMEQREWNRWVILVLTCSVFALAHFELKRAPLLLAIGLPIGIARMLSGRLAAPVIAHQINNFLPAVALTMLLLGHSLDA